MENKNESKGSYNLRRLAEKHLQETSDAGDDLYMMSPADMASLIHELRVHQIELKMQNEELRRIQGELEKTRDRYSHLYDFAPVGYFSGSEKGIITETNLTLASMLGAERSAMIGQPFTRFILTDDQDIYYKHRQRLMETNKPQTCELRLVKKDGHAFHARLECTLIHNEGDDVKQIRAVASDITEQKDLENQLRQAQKMEAIGALAGGIAHDFNNILVAVIGFAELALDSAEKGTPLADHLEEVLIGGKRAKLLVQQILTFGRKAPQKTVPLRIDSLVRETARLIRSTMPSTIGIDIDIKPTLNPCVLGDEAQIHQVILNLCTNAAHSMEITGGTMTIGIDAVTLENGRAGHVSNLSPGKYVKLSISDTGCGIRPENIERIFEPYFSTKEPDKGTGLGLAVVEGIVKAHKGYITVMSQPKEGTVFTIFLPLLEKTGSAPDSMPQKAPAGGEEHILLIDDELAIVKLNKVFLERLGYVVTTSTGSLEALDLFRLKPNDFDLVITDMTMPNMTGDKLAAELIKIRADIPIIICTGYSKAVSEELIGQIGIKALAYKPIDRVELTTTVRKVLDAGWTLPHRQQGAFGL
ncbi:MAG: response regulator [Desulfatitalea sp.]|nr:response regulator [Desulfatitalea sp.]NNK01832.1 response regulator [Desulfatitalea sp.]